MTFELNDIQLEKLNKWKEAIKTIYGEYGSFTYCFRPTGIGNAVTVESDLLGPHQLLELTDLSSW
jgi:hypothetical protein